MSKRVLDDFISSYMKYTEGTESPSSYHLWCSISAIASALQRRVFLRWGVETIFPNMYIVLIGPSGRCRKGVAMGIVQDLIRAVGIPYAAENITREKLIRRLKDGLSSYTDPDTGEVVFHCSLTAYSEELSVFLGQQDTRFLLDLTDWYNCKPEWTYDTKNMGTDKINNVCFNLMGATAPDWLPSTLPKESIGGGFTARIIFIAEEEKRSWIAIPPAPDLELRKNLIKDLEQIFLLCGEMRFTEEALELYSDFYLSQRDGNVKIKDQKFQSYNERRATHIKKLSMICCASRKDGNKIIQKCDVERAIKILEAAEIKMPRAFRAVGRSKYGDVTVDVFDYICRKGLVTASQILRHFYPDVDDYTLEIATKTLLAMKVIKVTRDTNSNELVYEAIKEGVTG